MIEFADRVAKLLAAGDGDAAAQLVASVAATNPAAHQVGRAALALHARDPHTALAHADQALALGAGAVAHQYAAMALLMAGDGAAAIDRARTAVALDGSVRNRSALGGVMLVAGRPADAAAVLRQVIAEHPRDVDALLNLATAASQSGDYGDAITYYAKAFDANPADQRPIRNLLTMFAEVGKWLGAMAALELSRTGEPPPEVAVTLDLVMVHLVRLVSDTFPPPGVADDADEAVRNLVANAAKRPAPTQLVAARTLVDMGRLAEAKQLLAKAQTQAAAGAERGNARYLEGFFAEQDGDKPRAIACYVQAVDADPARADAAVNAISLLLEDGSPSALARIGALVAQVAPEERRGNVNLLFNEAIYLGRSGRIDDARTNLERIQKITGGDGRIAAMARQALAELGGQPR